MADQRIRLAMRRLERRMSEDVDFGRLAAVAGLSRYHFHRRFVSELGVTPEGYLRRIRLDAAALRLRWTREDVWQIADGLGYRSQGSFTHAFAGGSMPPRRACGATMSAGPACPSIIWRIARLPCNRATDFTVSAEDILGHFTIPRRIGVTFLDQSMILFHQAGRCILVWYTMIHASRLKMRLATIAA